jgi:hypothetical protein
MKKAPSLAGEPGGSRVQSQREGALGEQPKAYAFAPCALSLRLSEAGDFSWLGLQVVVSIRGRFEPLAGASFTE